MLHLVKQNASLVIDGEFNTSRNNLSQQMIPELSNPFYPPLTVVTSQVSEIDSLSGEGNNVTLSAVNKSPVPVANVPFVECSAHETFCQVRRIEYVTSESKQRKFWAIERGCTSHCRQGCLIIGEGKFISLIILSLLTFRSTVNEEQNLSFY